MDARPQLTRFSIYVYKDVSALSRGRVPAAGWNVQLCRQGATVDIGSGFDIDHGETGVVLTVFDVGAIVGPPSYGYDGDTITADGRGQLIVTAVNAEDGTITVRNPSETDAVHIDEHTRLTPISAPLAQAYSNPIGAGDELSQPLNVDDGGRCECYVRTYRFDYIITSESPGSDPDEARVFADAVGGLVMRT